MTWAARRFQGWLMSDNSDRVSRSQERHLRQRARLLYSLRDFQIARSAAAFLAVCAPEEMYSLTEMRRFRCYETTMIVAYARPFSGSSGKIPSLSIKMAGARLTDEQLGLHKRVLIVRNKAIAHSDAETISMLSKSEPMTLNDDLAFFHAVFDEGLEFIGLPLQRLCDLIDVLYGSIFTKLFKNV